MAKKLPLDIVHLVVFDDDIFIYVVYREGKLLDEYNSAPDYFEEVSERKKAKLAGHPERFADLLKDAAAQVELKDILADRPVFAGESMQRFAALLGMPNAVTSFEYLEDGETDGIERFDEFVRVPEESLKDRRKAAVQAVAKATRTALQDRGVLLSERKAPMGGDGPLAPVWCENPEGGFLLIWVDHRSQGGTGPVLHLTSPWIDPEPLTNELSLHTHFMEVSASGRYLAVAAFENDSIAELWDFPARSRIGVVPGRRSVESSSFGAGEQQIALRTMNEITLVECHSAKVVKSVIVPLSKAVAFHPGGRYLVFDHPEGLAILDSDSGRVVKVLSISDDSDPSAADLRLLAQLVEEREERRRELEDYLAQMKGLDDDLRKQRLKLLREFEADINEGYLPEVIIMSRQGAEKVGRMKFSPDGGYLLLATSQGVRVYDWDDLLSTRESAPEPRLAREAEPVIFHIRGSGSTGSWVYDLLHDPIRNLLLYCGLDSKLSALNLSTGRAGPLTPWLGPDGLTNLCRTTDGKYLGSILRPIYAERPKDSGAMLHVWDYERLIGPAL